MKAGWPKISIAALQQELTVDLEKRLSVAEVMSTADSIDLEALRTQHLTRIETEELEPGEKIAGFDYVNEHPNPWLRKKLQDIVNRGGKIYKQYIDGKLTVIQWHIPHVGGHEPITKNPACNKKCTPAERRNCNKECVFKEVANYHEMAWAHEQAVAEAHEKILRQLAK